MTTIPGITVECDPAVEECGGIDSVTYIYPEVSPSSLYWLGSIGLLNSLIPITYWFFSQDFTGEYSNYRGARPSGISSITD